MSGSRTLQSASASCEAQTSNPSIPSLTLYQLSNCALYGRRGGGGGGGGGGGVIMYDELNCEGKIGDTCTLALKAPPIICSR